MALLLGLLTIVGIVFGVYLIIVLARLAGTMKKVNKLVGDVDEPVSKTVGQLPDLIKKLDGVTADVAVLTQSAKESVPAVLNDVQTMTGTVRGGVEAVGGAAKSVGDSVSSFFHPAKQAGGGGLGAIVDVIGQIMSVVTLFTGRSKSQKKARSRSKRR